MGQGDKGSQNNHHWLRITEKTPERYLMVADVRTNIET
jgi:hypothetical protein